MSKGGKGKDVGHKLSNRPCESSTTGTVAESDDQSVLVKTMMESIEAMNTRLIDNLTEKMGNIITDLKSCLLDTKIQETTSQANQEELARPFKGFTTESVNERPLHGLGQWQRQRNKDLPLDKYAGTSTKILPANWIKSYETMASLHNWTEQYMVTVLRFYLTDEALTWYDNQATHGIETMSWYQVKQRFEKFFSQDQVVTPKAVLNKEWDPKVSSFYEHYRDMLRLFEVSKLQDSWRVNVLKTSLPPYYIRMCSGIETDDTDEWYRRAANIISSLPKFEPKTSVRAVATVHEIKALARTAPIDKHDGTDDPSKCLFCCQLSPNHKVEDCFCHPRKIRAAIARRNINVLEETNEEENHDESILTEADLEDEDEPLEMNVTAVPASMSLLSADESINSLAGVSNKVSMKINNIISVEGLLDSGASISAICEKLCSEWNISFKPLRRELASVHGYFLTKGFVVVDVQIGPYQSKVQAYVVESPPYPFILGINEFKAFGISWSYPYLLDKGADETAAQRQTTGNDRTAVQTIEKTAQLSSHSAIK